MPEKRNFAEAGPLLCGGVTVFAALAMYAKPTDWVGIIGIGGPGHMAVKFAAPYGCDVTAFTSSVSKFDEAKGFGANHVVSSKHSPAIRKLGGSFDVLISTVNVKLDWDAMIGTLAPNGRLHVVGAVLNRSRSRHSPSSCSSVASRVRRLARRWRSRRCSTLLHGTMSRRRPSTSR